MNYRIAAGAGYVLYLIGIAVTAKLLNIGGENYYIFMGLMAALGFSAVGAFMWFFEKRQRDNSGSSDAGGGGSSSGAGSGEIDTLIRDADARLAASRHAQGAGISNLPLIFLIGQQGSIKTSTMLHSGLDAELLAGQVYQESNAVAPTRAANVWFANNAVFAEAGARILWDAK